MRYSVDFRKRAIALAKKEKNKSKVCRWLRIGRTTLDRWLARNDLTPHKPGPTAPRKLNLDELKEHVKAHADAYQRERADDLKVSRATIGRGLRKLGIRRKKNDALPRKKRHLSQ